MQYWWERVSVNFTGIKGHDKPCLSCQKFSTSNTLDFAEHWFVGKDTYFPLYLVCIFLPNYLGSHMTGNKSSLVWFGLMANPIYTHIYPINIWFVNISPQG